MAESHFFCDLVYHFSFKGSGMIDGDFFCHLFEYFFEVLFDGCLFFNCVFFMIF